MVDRGIKILNVEDSAMMRKVMTGILNKWGFNNLESAENGQEAMLRIEEGGIDLVLTDWHMPGSSGLGLIKAVRADPQLAKLPIVMITAEQDRDMVKHALQAGATGFIIKPFNPQKILKAVEAAMARA